MKIILICFFITNILISQIHIRFFQTPDITTIRQIEREIIKNVIELYNRKSVEKYTFTFEEMSPFPKIFDYLEFCEGREEGDVIASINSISITEERKQKFDFSTIYLPAFDVIFSLKENKNASIENLKKGNHAVAFHVGTTQEHAFNKMKPKFSFIQKPYIKYKERVDALFNKHVLYAVGDNVEVWDDKRLKIIYKMPYQEGKGFAILYPKGSKLKTMLDSHLKYYIRSAKFKSLIKRKYGEDISNYFRKNL